VFAGSLTGMPVAKDAPKEGPERLIHFVKQRLADLGITQEELAARGGPDRSTLGKLRSRPGQQTPTVATLVAYDDTLGWERGSTAVVLLGGTPQEAHSGGSTGSLPNDEKTARLLRQADRRADKLAELLTSATRESEHLRRQLAALIGAG
jgi:helix-turn-helix protein